MRFPLLAVVVWPVSVVLQTAVAVALWKNGQLRRWPFLFALCAYDVLRSAALAPISTHEHRVAYFYVYWVTAIGDTLLSFGLMSDVVRSIPGLTYISRTFKMLMSVIGGTILVGTFLLSILEKPKMSVFAQFELNLQSAADLCWLALFIALLAGISLLGIAWCRSSIAVTIGVLANGVTAAIASQVIRYAPHFGQKIDALHSTAYVAVLVWWIVVFTRKGHRASEPGTSALPLPLPSFNPHPAEKEGLE